MYIPLFTRYSPDQLNGPYYDENEDRLHKIIEWEIRTEKNGAWNTATLDLNCCSKYYSVQDADRTNNIPIFDEETFHKTLKKDDPYINYQSRWIFAEIDVPESEMKNLTIDSNAREKTYLLPRNINYPIISWQFSKAFDMLKPPSELPQVENNLYAIIRKSDWGKVTKVDELLKAEKQLNKIKTDILSSLDNYIKSLQQQIQETICFNRENKRNAIPILEALKAKIDKEYKFSLLEELIPKEPRLKTIIDDFIQHISSEQKQLCEDLLKSGISTNLSNPIKWALSNPTKSIIDIALDAEKKLFQKEPTFTFNISQDEEILTGISSKFISQT